MDTMVMVGFRLERSDGAWLTERANATGLSVSVYLRQLVRLARATDDALGEAALFERHTQHLIFRELRRQGVNLNQGVHALNTIAMQLERGRSTGDWMRELFERASLALDMATDAHDDIESTIETLNDRILLGGA